MNSSLCSAMIAQQPSAVNSKYKDGTGKPGFKGPNVYSNMSVERWHKCKKHCFMATADAFMTPDEKVRRSPKMLLFIPVLSLCLNKRLYL